jgi:hypothetical protein
MEKKQSILLNGHCPRITAKLGSLIRKCAKKLEGKDKYFTGYIYEWE